MGEIKFKKSACDHHEPSCVMASEKGRCCDRCPSNAEGSRTTQPFQNHVLVFDRPLRTIELFLPSLLPPWSKALLGEEKTAPA